MKTDNESETRESNSLGIILALGQFNASDIISEADLAALVKRHQVSIKRAVARGELPQPTKFFGQLVWTVGAINAHIEDRLRQAAEEQARLEKKMEELRP